MSKTPRTIQIYLPDGEPTGIREAEITTSILKIIEFPRAELHRVAVSNEFSQVGVYILIGEDENGQDIAYIGQSGELKSRLGQHAKSKDFWNRGIAILSKTNSITQTHALYIEWRAIQTATEAGRYRLENANTGSKPHTPAPLEADCNVLFDAIKTLTGVLGYSLFKPLRQSEDSPSAKEIFYLKRGGVDAQCEYTNEGFVVLEGSKGKSNIAETYNYLKPQRDQLIKQGIVRIEGDEIIFTKDHLFKSPSAASSAVLGMASNGWSDWKDTNGVKLDSKRQ